MTNIFERELHRRLLVSTLTLYKGIFKRGLWLTAFTLLGIIFWALYFFAIQINRRKCRNKVLTEYLYGIDLQFFCLHKNLLKKYFMYIFVARFDFWEQLQKFNIAVFATIIRWYISCRYIKYLRDKSSPVHKINEYYASLFQYINICYHGYKIDENFMLKGTQNYH